MKLLSILFPSILVMTSGLLMPVVLQAKDGHVDTHCVSQIEASGGVEALILQNRQAVRDMAVSLASKIPHGYENLDDLIGAGNLALVRAAHDYDPELNQSFMSFAQKGIEFAMQDFLHSANPIPKEKQRSLTAIAQTLHSPSEPTSLEAEISTAEKQWLEAAIKRLTTQQQEALRLVYYNGATVTEAATAMDNSDEKVSQLVSEGLRNLKRYLIQ